MDESKRTVNRVDDPTPAGSSTRFTFLFAQNTVVGKPHRDLPPDVRLSFAVGDRDVTAVGFDRGLRLLAKVLECDVAGLSRQFDRKLEKFVIDSLQSVPFRRRPSSSRT